MVVMKASRLGGLFRDHLDLIAKILLVEALREVQEEPGRGLSNANSQFCNVVQLNDIMEVNNVTELQIGFSPFLSRDVWIGFRSVAKIVL